MDKLRLLFVSHSFPPKDDPTANVGGMQRVAYDLCHTLDLHPQVIQQSLVLRTSWKSTVFKMPTFFARVYRYIGRLIESERVDAVLFSSMVTAGLLSFMKHKFKTQQTLALSIAHGLDVTWPYTLYQNHVRNIFHMLDGVFPVSRHTQQACLERGASPHSTFTIPNGISPTRFTRYQNLPNIRQALSATLGHHLPSNAHLLLSVGRLVPRKGFAWFVDQVMPQLPSHIHYWIGGHGPEAEHIQRAIVRHNLQERVRLLGLIDEQHLELLYRGADQFIMPNIPQENDVEGFGVVMLEAGICGLPTIASNREGIRDVITNGINGHLVKCQDVKAFCSHILNSRTDDFMRTQVKTHTEQFSWTHIGDQFVDHIYQLKYKRQALAI